MSGCGERFPPKNNSRLNFGALTPFAAQSHTGLRAAFHVRAFSPTPSDGRRRAARSSSFHEVCMSGSVSVGVVTLAEAMAAPPPEAGGHALVVFTDGALALGARDGARRWAMRRDCRPAPPRSRASRARSARASTFSRRRASPRKSSSSRASRLKRLAKRSIISALEAWSQPSSARRSMRACCSISPRRRPISDRRRRTSCWA